MKTTGKIAGETDEDMIDMALGNIVMDVVKRAKELKAAKTEVGGNEAEKTCAKCGALNSSSSNFCSQCGGKY